MAILQEVGVGVIKWLDPIKEHGIIAPIGSVQWDDKEKKYVASGEEFEEVTLKATPQPKHSELYFRFKNVISGSPAVGQRVQYVRKQTATDTWEAEEIEVLTEPR